MKKEEVIMDNKKLAFWLIVIVVVLTVVLFVVDYNREGVLLSPCPFYIPLGECDTYLAQQVDSASDGTTSSSGTTTSSSSSGASSTSGITEATVLLGIGYLPGWNGFPQASLKCKQAFDGLLRASVDGGCGEGQGAKIECGIDNKHYEFDVAENGFIVGCSAYYDCKGVSSECLNKINNAVFTNEAYQQTSKLNIIKIVPYCSAFPEACDTGLIDSRISQRDEF